MNERDGRRPKIECVGGIRRRKSGCVEKKNLMVVIYRRDLF